MLTKIEGYITALQVVDRANKTKEIFDVNKLVEVAASAIRDNPSIPVQGLTPQLYSTMKTLWLYDPHFLKYPFPVNGDVIDGIVSITISTELSQQSRDCLVVMFYMRFGSRVDEL